MQSPDKALVPPPYYFQNLVYIAETPFACLFKTTKIEHQGNFI